MINLSSGDPQSKYTLIFSYLKLVVIITCDNFAGFSIIPTVLRILYSALKYPL
jgi:hypothetical protein